MPTISINGKPYQAHEGENVLKVALREGIEIPYLCYQVALSPFGACRLCIIEVMGGGNLELLLPVPYLLRRVLLLRQNQRRLSR